MMPKNQTTRIDDLLASVTPEMLGSDPQNLFKDDTVRVERILLELLRPDPIQPRRVLPERIHFEFHQQRLTPSQALRELVQIAQVAARGRGQPFSNVLELLPNADTETPEDAEPKLSPEEVLLHDLINLAVTIRDDGQVNPLTVVDVSQGVTRLYRIETGERRYWATWLLRDFITPYTGDGMAPCIIIPEKKSSVFRQARENTARAGLSAVAMARQAALLLLTVHGYEIPPYAVTNDFYRQALNLDLRGKREYTDMILSAMGGIGRMRFSHFKALLNLSDEAFEIADRHQLDEGKLRYVVQLPSEEHAEMLMQIINLGLTTRQVKEICEQGGGASSDEEQVGTATKERRFVRLARTLDMETPQQLAQAFLNEEKSASLARARIHTMLQFLTEAQRCLPEE